eukprot:gene42174-62751_t
MPRRRSAFVLFRAARKGGRARSAGGWAAAVAAAFCAAATA